MRTWTIGLWMSLGVTVVAACGSDESPSGRSRMIDQVVADAKAQDIEVDEPCIARVVDQFSEADFAIVEQNATDPDVAALSPAAQGLIVQLVDCTGGRPGGTIPPAGGLSTSQTLILEQIRASLDSRGVAYDDACLSALIQSVDTGALANEAFALDLVTQAQACVTQ